MDPTPLLSAFVLISLTELGDKTMVAVIALSSKHSRLMVFLGAFLALLTLTAIGVVLGEVLFRTVPSWVVGLTAGIVFILFGVLFLLFPEKEEVVDEPRRWGGLLSVFGLVALMELGDRSQLSVITLAAESGAALMVFVGAALGFLWLTALEVYLGKAIGEKVPKRYIRMGSGLVFILFGVLFLVRLL
jgi:putative Ca2+/H+ antiporter (TMEM165/GDT1 family)